MTRPDPRQLAIEALVRIDGGAFANLVLAPLLDRSGLDGRDRAFATELVYGTTRMRRALDHLLAPHLRRPLQPEVRAALRIGAYQLAFLDTPPHAAVSATVGAAHRPARGLVNAVLRRVAESLPPQWPDPATELSYPDWIVDRLVADLGREAALGALAAMNEPAVVHQRPDGYVQDPASQQVARYVGAGPGEVVVDLCAAPGGKATLMAHGGPALVVANDLQPSRARLVAGNAAATGSAAVAAVVGDGRCPPLLPGTADRVLVDAPCTGLGVLRRRADARWRVEAPDIDRLAALQRELLSAGAELVRPGGTLVYSVCTLTAAETAGIDRWLGGACPDLEPLASPPPPWEPVGRGARILPQAAGTDGMFVLGLSRRRR